MCELGFRVEIDRSAQIAPPPAKGMIIGQILVALAHGLEELMLPEAGGRHSLDNGSSDAHEAGRCVGNESKSILTNGTKLAHIDNEAALLRDVVTLKRIGARHDVISRREETAE